MGDEVRLKQVMLNLLSNAVKFTEIGYISLEIKLIEMHNKRYVTRFSFTDTGIGIFPDKIEGIFTGFLQEDGTITRKFGGAGLGITIASKLVEMMGGHIHVTSVKTKGSIFWFDLSLLASPIKIQHLPQNMPKDFDGWFDGRKPGHSIAEDYQTNQIVFQTSSRKCRLSGNFG